MFRQSPRGIWVKIRKILAYLLISFLYIGVLPTSLQQFFTGQIPGVLGNAWPTIIVVNVLVYGVFVLLIWLLLKHYKRDEYRPYKQRLEKAPKEEVDSREFTLDKTSKINVIVAFLKSVLEYIIFFFKKKWKWLLALLIAFFFVLGVVGIYSFVEEIYIPEKIADQTLREIMTKFNDKETRTEYAAYILFVRTYDWDGKDYNNEYEKKIINDCLKGKLDDYEDEAFNWIESNAYNGDSKCQYLLGYYYEEWWMAWGDKNRKEKAAYWYLESANRGFVPAFNNIAKCYKYGIGVKSDMNKTIDWLKKGAEAGDPYAQYNYGDLFMDGVEIVTDSSSKRVPIYYNWKTEMVYKYKTLISKDIEQAKYWWKKAASQGHMGAKDRLQKIYE